MKVRIATTRAIDALTERVGRGLYWLMLVAVLVSAANAVMRYPLSASPRAWLEIEWYLFAAVFLFCAGYAPLYTRHGRFEVVSSRFSWRVRTWLEICGTVFLVLPMTMMIIWMSWPVITEAFQRQEVWGSSGGLIVWPARLLVPLGFLLLVLQCLSQLIKSFAFLAGPIPDPTGVRHEESAKESSPAELRRCHDDGLDTRRATEPHLFSRAGDAEETFSSPAHGKYYAVHPREFPLALEEGWKPTIGPRRTVT